MSRVHETFPAANAEYVKDFNQRNLGGLALPPGKKVKKLKLT